MKGRLLYWLKLFAVCSSCRNVDTQSFARVFVPTYKPKPITVQYHTLYTTPLCSEGIWINSDSTFTDERGCESSSHVAAGTWTRRGDTIIASALTRKQLKLSFSYSLSNYNHQDTVVFIVTDKANQPIEGFFIQSFNQKPHYIPGNRTDGGKMMIDDGINDGEYAHYTTSVKGIASVSKVQCDSLDFTELFHLTGRPFRISSKQLPDTIRLTININAVALYRSGADYWPFKEPIKIPCDSLKQVTTH